MTSTVKLTINITTALCNARDTSCSITAPRLCLLPTLVEKTIGAIENKNKNQLTANEVNNIIEEINDLNNIVDGDIIINYKGNKKLSNKNDIEKIFEKYFLKN